MPAMHSGGANRFMNQHFLSKLSPTNEAVQAGFRFGDKGTHTSLTMMLSELAELLGALPADASREDYASAIIDDNVLGKKTASTRRAFNQRMGELYSLDLKLPIFRVLRRLWEIDDKGRPLIAMLCALARDPLLRITAPVVISLDIGDELIRQSYLNEIRSSTGDRLNEMSVDKVARNTGSSWAQSGHLEGRVRKIRKLVEPTACSVAFALWMGSLFHLSGEELLSTPWTAILDSSHADLLEHTLYAKRLRLLDASVGGGVVEINTARIDPNMEVPY